MMIIVGQTNHYISDILQVRSNRSMGQCSLTNTYSGPTTDSLGFYSIEKSETEKFLFWLVTLI